MLVCAFGGVIRGDGQSDSSKNYSVAKLFCDLFLVKLSGVATKKDDNHNHRWQ